MVLSATDEPIFFLSFVLTASAHVQQPRVPSGVAIHPTPSFHRDTLVHSVRCVMPCRTLCRSLW